jgi:hypothetical protein
MQQKECTLFPDYHQFYIWDAKTHGEPPQDYTEEDVSTRVKIGQHLCVVLTASDMHTVPVSVVVMETAPEIDTDAWNQIVECSIEVPSGSLQLHECTGGPVADFEVVPGSYRVRVLFKNLTVENIDADEGDDSYVVQCWPAPVTGIQIIKSQS